MTNANVHELFRPLLNAISQPAAATLTESRALELMYDGPIPPSALGDLRATMKQPTPTETVTDYELQILIGCQKLRVDSAQKNLNAERRILRRTFSMLRKEDRAYRRPALETVWTRYTRAHASVLDATAKLIDLLREQSRRTAANIQHAAE